MAKRVRKKMARAKLRTAEEAALVVERRRLQRSVNHQRRIRALARQLVTTQAQASQELEQLAHAIIDRKRAPARMEDELEAVHG